MPLRAVSLEGDGDAVVVRLRCLGTMPDAAAAPNKKRGRDGATPQTTTMMVEPRRSFASKLLGTPGQRAKAGGGGGGQAARGRGALPQKGEGKTASATVRADRSSRHRPA